jgi:hypothetical protein
MAMNPADFVVRQDWEVGQVIQTNSFRNIISVKNYYYNINPLNSIF